ncbi:MAG: hypothetical protein SPJ49_04540 [Bacilli bacterium]|nr:hypothetical protein [Bacilli bacterium]
MQKIKPYLSRKNLIVIAITALFSCLTVFVGLCLSAVKGGLISPNNPILALATSLKLVEGPVTLNNSSGIVSLILVAIYIIVFVTAIIYVYRFQKLNKISWKNPKIIIAYIATTLLSILLSIGVAIVIQLTYDEPEIVGLLTYLGVTLLISLILAAIIGLFLGAIIMIVVNFILIDKPYRFFSKNAYDELDDEEEKVSDVTSNFDNSNVVTTSSIVSSFGQPQVGGASNQENNDENKARSLDDREKVFPGLSSIDTKYNGYANDKIETDDITLDKLATGFRNYLAKEEKLYYDIDSIRMFISGFASSRLEILEGLSGTGKSSLPRYFAKYVSANVLFMPVQATWRDKSSVLGYFNDFARSYNETDFLLSLYEASYNPDVINIYVLDEMNISRVEYYFADFLSVLEYPSDQWKIRLLQLPYGFIPPSKLDEGYLKIPTNSYFVGTANKDDSTFSISDKVYDRAITMFFDNRNEPFEVKEDVAPIKLSASKLQSLYQEALNNKQSLLKKADYQKLMKITDFIYDEFDVTFGNRILNQIEIIVPVFVACGGTKESALDFLLSRKLLAKLEGRFEEYVKASLKRLLELINQTYGSGVLPRSTHIINNLIKRL